MLAFERDKVDRLEIKAGTSAVALAREGSEWTLKTPVQAAADYGTVEGLVGRLQSAQMKAITAPDAADLKPYGLDKPDATVTVGLGSSRATLVLGAKTDAGTVYAKDESRPMVFTVESSLLDDLKKPADQLRRKDVFAFRAFNANAVEITRGGATLAFEKVKGGGAEAAEKWRQTRPAARDVDGTAMDTFLTRLSNLRAQSFVATDGKTKTGLQAPAMTVSVKFDDGRKEEKVTFGREGADVFAGIAGQPGAAKIDAAEFDDAVKALDAVAGGSQPAAPPAQPGPRESSRTAPCATAPLPAQPGFSRHWLRLPCCWPARRARRRPTHEPLPRRPRPGPQPPLRQSRLRPHRRSQPRSRPPFARLRPRSRRNWAGSSTRRRSTGCSGPFSCSRSPAARRSTAGTRRS